MADTLNKEMFNSCHFQRELLHETLSSQRLRCITMSGVFLCMSALFLIGGYYQVLPDPLFKQNWGVLNYHWIIFINSIVASFEFANYLYLKRQKINQLYLKVFPYTVSFVEAIYPTFIIWLLSHTIPVKTSLQTGPVLLYSLIIILSALHISPRACVFTGTVSSISYLAVALIMNHPVTEAGVSIKAVLFIITGIVAAIVTNEIKKNLIRSRTLASDKEEAESANLTKSKFLAAASHDLRQPLHALTLFVDILNSRTSDSHNKETIKSIKKSATALEDLLSALLDISKLDAQVVIPKVRGFDLSELIDRLSDEFKPVFNKKEVEFKLECNEAIVRSDPVLLETVLRNLLSNAIRYTNKG